MAKPMLWSVRATFAGGDYRDFWADTKAWARWLAETLAKGSDTLKTATLRRGSTNVATYRVVKGRLQIREH